MAADLDVLTFDEAKAAINNNADDKNIGLLSAYITGVSQFLDTLCGPIVSRTVTDTFDGDLPAVFLKSWPVLSVQTVTEYTGTTSQLLTAQTPGTAPDFGYLLDLASGQIRRTEGGTARNFKSGVQNVVVEYTAGRFADTESVDQRFKRAAGLVLANIWRRERGLGAVEYGVVGGVTYLLPNAAEALLLGEIHPPAVA